MSTPDQVVCIWDDWHIWAGPETATVTPVKEQIYTICDVTEVFDQRFYTFVELSPLAYFCADCFRPVRKTGIDVFTKLLVPTPKVILSARMCAYVR